MDLKKIFDDYGRTARLKPALFTAFPIILTVAAWNPALYSLVSGLIGLAAACGVVLFLAHWARTRGRQAESRMEKESGGKITASFLRFSDNRLDSVTKTRYCTFLQARIPAWTAPTIEQERADASSADATYDSGVRWLLEYTRDVKRFPLIYKELVSYGFRRNLYGLKPIAITISVICTSINIGMLLTKDVPDSSFGIISLVVSVVSLVAWISVIDSDWVRDSANAYARQLLAVCEGLN